jgi:hypothetical protein
MKLLLSMFFAVSGIFSTLAQDRCGAVIPWTTYEAEQMHTNGTILGPGYMSGTVEVESSGQKAVRLAKEGQFVEFVAMAMANSMVIRYSIPDTTLRRGWWSELGIYDNGHFVKRCPLTPRYAWLYGKYPFSNDPKAGQPRHFYDEVRISGLDIKKGDRIRIRPTGSEKFGGGYCILDLVDLEEIPPPLQRPSRSLSFTDKEFADAVPGGVKDYTELLRKCITKAAATGQTVWIPPGNYKITGDIVIPAHVSIQGAGIWYAAFTGDDSVYAYADRRVRLKGNGDSIHLSDFAITGRLTYRSDQEPNDGIVGSFGNGSTIARIWIEHTKVGMWIENTQDLRITDCRMRNTMADGINFCVGMSRSVIQNCTARGTGDDCFAIWPAAFLQQQFQPGHNLIVRCTGQLPYLANGAAIYGGESNAIRDCSFADISQGSAILISTTFPTSGKDNSPENNFSGRTVVDNCYIRRSGGFDHEWGWRGALEVCLDRRNISGLSISRIRVDSSLSNALSIVEGKGRNAALSDAVLERFEVSGYGLGLKESHALFIASGAKGGLVIKDSVVATGSLAVSGSGGADIDNRSTGFVLTRE